jgi:hypothetical protein
LALDHHLKPNKHRHIYPLNRHFLWLPFEQTKQEQVIYHAQKQANYRPNETATYPRFGNSDDIVGWKSKEAAATKARTNKDGSNQRREGENNAAQLLAETAESSEGIDRK